ncbi:MAG: ubiquinone biosynthesis regulatory protein kinase UbiB [Gammaproteobacteria bacterium]|nr:ubiquinone biosynthesis regulatory protein kinase UbiB [Gammaproteobacteria bacterium]MYF28057.1 ubiquinone biosynthesis regulatory protein kinase UbiB [Gammaproteobacteria bacterium]MYK46984.1 ubiquinone biosynthesis regulatory protein kinase UbiB [Gammaproteobacteria bacterium]
MTRAGRVARILLTVARHRLDRNVDRFAGHHWWYRLSPLRLLPAPGKPDAVRLREAMEKLGPVFVKFGQILSTRRDLLPADYADELAKLQDQVPPFPGDLAVARIEAALGDSITSLFQSFDLEPLASASLAQVHAATMAGGDEVAVKVIRPDIERVIEKDLALIHTMASLLERISRDARRLRLKAVVADYERTIFDELNLQKEAANTATLRRNFATSELLYAPKVYWERCAESVLTLERVRAVPISDIEALRAAGTDMKKLAERGVETFFTQLFKHNFFHADMHPGNIFIDIEDPANPSYIAIDCAIIGTLSEEDQSYLARNVLAFLNRDYGRIARLHIESGWIPAGTDPREFEDVIRQLLEPIFQRPLNEISFGHFLVALFQTARRFNMEVQPQLVLLQKTLLNIEGLGRQLYPDLDLWNTAKPFMESWMRERYGAFALLTNLIEHAPTLAVELPRLLPQIPDIVATAMHRFTDMDRRENTHRQAMERLTNAIVGQNRRARWRRAAGGVLVALGLVLLWRPLADAITAGDSATVTAGVVAALAGSVLVLRG